MLSSFVRRRDVQLWSFVVAFIAAGPVMPSDDPKPDLAPISVTIHLPADADLEIQGKKVEGSGELRHETVIPTKNEPESLYTFKASWKECDKIQTKRRALRLKPGGEAELDLNLDLNEEEKSILSLINKE